MTATLPNPTAATPLDDLHPAKRVEFRDSDHAYLVRTTCATCLGSGRVPGAREGTTKKCAGRCDEGIRRNRVPAVSTILSELNKPALVQWAANMGADAARAWVSDKLDSMEMFTSPVAFVFEDEIDALHAAIAGAHREKKDDAADTGTAVHDWIESYVTIGADLPEDPAVRPACEAFVAWWATSGLTVVESERIVVDTKARYAGRFDLLVRDARGNLYVLDFKTSNSVYVEHVLQLAAYATAIREELGESIKGTIVVWCHKEGRRVRTVHRTAREYRADFHVFAALLGVYEHRKESGLGSALRKLASESATEAEATADLADFLAS